MRFGAGLGGRVATTGGEVGRGLGEGTTGVGFGAAAGGFVGAVTPGGSGQMTATGGGGGVVGGGGGGFFTHVGWVGQSGGASGSWKHVIGFSPTMLYPAAHSNVHVGVVESSSPFALSGHALDATPAVVVEADVVIAGHFSTIATP